MLRKVATGAIALCMAAALTTVGCGDDDGAECGNGEVEGSEVCDGSDLDGNTCADHGFTGGTLACNATCDAFDTSMCTSTNCGNDTQEDPEQCDGADLGGNECTDRGFYGGTLACTDMCTFDETGCVGECGDNTIDVGEEVCDGADLGTADCTTEGHDGGQLACLGDCTGYDTLGCCDDACPAENDTQCAGDILSTCTVATNGCLEWVDLDCTTTGEVCGGDPAACIPGCTSDCPNLGDTQCTDATTLETCTDSGNGCINWVSSTCTGGYCGGATAQCWTSGSGWDCNDVYSLDGRTFPHVVVGDFATGAYTFQGTCQDGANPLYMSYTVQGSNLDTLVISVEDSSWTYPEISAWTSTEATGFCDPAQRTELGCATGSSTQRTLTLDASALNPGDVIYFLAGGDGMSWSLEDPTIIVSEQACGNGAVELGEECDDGNATTGDGCDDQCAIETGYWCTGEPSNCMIPACGDGFVNDAAEECDDGNLTANDGCDASCIAEAFACGGGATLVTIDSTDVGQTVTDATPVLSTLTVANTGTILRVRLTLDASHTYDADLDIYLLSPASTSVELTTDNGGFGDDFIDTVFDDGCLSNGDGSITVGSAPFTGCYAPEGSLSDFIGETANGVWTLQIDDDAGGDDGTLNGWTLDLCVQ